MEKEGKKKRVGESTISDIMPEVVFMSGKRTEDSNGWKDKEYITFKGVDGRSTEYKKAKLLQFCSNIRPFHPYVIQSNIEGIQTISNCFETYFFVKPNKFFWFLNYDVNTLSCLNDTVHRSDIPFWIDRVRPVAEYLQKFCFDALIKHGDITSPDILFHFTMSITFCKMKQKEIISKGGSDKDGLYLKYESLIEEHKKRNEEIFGWFGMSISDRKISLLDDDKPKMPIIEYYNNLDKYSPLPSYLKQKVVR